MYSHVAVKSIKSWGGFEQLQIPKGTWFKLRNFVGICRDFVSTFVEQLCWVIKSFLVWLREQKHKHSDLTEESSVCSVA